MGFAEQDRHATARRDQACDGGQNCVEALDGTQGDCVVLVVKNAGTIPPAILPYLFDPFRGGQREPGRGEGLGLGLYIVSQIVQAHGGTVDVKTGDGDTAFYVRLPRGEP